MDYWAQPVVPPDTPFANGRTNVASNVGYDGPALTGAANVVLPGLSHNACARSPLAFREMYCFITGQEPDRLDVVPEDRPVLDGMVTGLVGGLPSNLPVASAKVDVFEVSPSTGERVGPAVHSRITSTDGRWGPFAASPIAYYEFVVAVPGYPVQHVYRQPFPRSSAFLNWRARDYPKGVKGVPGSVIVMSTGGDALYRGRDIVLIDGQAPPDLQPGPNDNNEAKTHMSTDRVRPVEVKLNDQKLVAQTWLAQNNNMVLVQFHY